MRVVGPAPARAPRRACRSCRTPCRLRRNAGEILGAWSWRPPDVHVCVEAISDRSTQVGPAVDVDGLARDVARTRAAQEAYRGGDLGGRDAIARERMVRRMVLRLGHPAR